jgi:sugar lactone lactonase YvrE
MRRILSMRLAVGCLAAGLSTGICIADRTEITFADARVFPESLTAIGDGTIFFSSVSKNSVYRAAPNSASADVWITLGAPGDQGVTGILADEAARTLWVCTNATDGSGRGGFPVRSAPAGETALRAFSLSDKTVRGVYRLPGDSVCNDIAIARDGTVYVSDTVGRRVLRLKKGAFALDVWTSDPALNSPDGIAVLADGVYVGCVRTGELVRVVVNGDGSAGTVTKIETSQKLQSPDGMREVGDRTLLLTETVGRLDEVTMREARAEVRVLKDGLEEPTAVTLVNGVAYVTEAKLRYWIDPKLRDQNPGVFRAVAVPYSPK